MSLIIDKVDLSPKEEALLLKLSKVKELRTNFNPYPKTYKLYVDAGSSYIFPRAIGIKGKTWQEYYSLQDYNIKFSCKKQLFTGNAGNNPDKDGQDRNQYETVKEGVKILKDTGYVFYNFSTGYGKTQCAIETIRQLGRRCLWLVYNSELQKQTFSEIKENTNAKVYWFQGKDSPPDTAQIVICGLVKATRLDSSFLSTFQTLVLDECDQTAAKSYFPLFLKSCPTFLLGLSATTKKSNGMEKVMYKYFGEKETFIYRFIEKPNSTIVKFQTPFVPNIQTQVNTLGQLQVDQHEISKSLAENLDRNRLVLDIVYEKAKDGQCLVLSPRQENIHWLARKLSIMYTRIPKEKFLTAMQIHLKPKWKELLHDHPLEFRAEYIIQYSKNSILVHSAKRYIDAMKMVDYKTVGKKNIDKTSRVLIGGLQSCGRGFDCRAKYLFLLGIPPNLTQFVGRLRDPNGFVYIFVDQYQKFESDWSKKAMPYLRKLGCQLFFQNVDEEMKPYAVEAKVAVDEECVELLD